MKVGNIYERTTKNNYDETYNKVKLVLKIILIANIAVAVTKIIVGNLINSASLSADGIHSLSDGMSNIVGIIGITIASKPDDKEHPYGHKKSEIIASLFIGVMLFLLGVNIFNTGIGRFINHETLYISTFSLISLIITIFINLGVALYEHKKGEEYGSYILISDSIHTRSDILISIGVLISLIGIELGLPDIIDPIISIIICIFILYSSYEIFKETISILLDSAVIDQESIKAIVGKFPEVKDIHNIRSRGSENDIYIDMHIMIDPDTNIEDSHDLSHRIEEEIKNKINDNSQVIIHIEPYYRKENIL